MIDGISVVGLTPSALLGIAILMLFTGRLWTNAAYQQKCKEAEQWKAAYETERESRKISDEQTAELLELARTTNAVMGALFQSSVKVQQSGGSDAVYTTLPQDSGP